MRDEAVIRQLRDEVASWIDIVMNMHPSMRSPKIISHFVLIHDSLNWALGDLDKMGSPELGFDTVIAGLRETMAEAKAKQQKHRNPLAN